ncbi:MAG TPA: hypothetical protein VNN80_11810 [Polyangiaceae bacterium]|nr:hypothetical protein [Polyangiaceae bacterium]
MNATLRVAVSFLSTLLLVLAVPLTGRAAITEEGAPNIMVRPFDGPKAKALQERVVKVLEEQGADLVPAGFEGPTAMETDADYASVAARLNIQAYIQGEATNDNTGWKLKLTVRQGSDGTVVGGAEFQASWFPGLLTKIDEELIGTLEKALSGAKVPEGAPEEAPQEETEAPKEEEAAPPKPLALDAGVGFVFRSFQAKNAVTLPGVLPTRDQSGGMADLRIGAAFYPGALFTKGFAANVGVVGHFERSLGGNTQAGDDPNDQLPEGDLPTSLTAYDVGLRVRLPISQHELGFSGVYGQQAFLIDDGGTESDPTVPGADPKLVPDVVYSFIRLGTDFSYIFSKYTLRADVGLRIVNSAGEEAGQIQNDEWFPNSDVGGVDVGLTAGYAVSERFTVTLGADFRNFFYSMNSREADFGIESGDRNPVAGGANDMYFAGMLMASYALQ